MAGDALRKATARGHVSHRAPTHSHLHAVGLMSHQRNANCKDGHLSGTKVAKIFFHFLSIMEIFKSGKHRRGWQAGPGEHGALEWWPWPHWPGGGLRGWTVTRLVSLCGRKTVGGEGEERRREPRLRRAPEKGTAVLGLRAA